MIYTVTFNPSLDYFVDVKGLKLGLTNRSDEQWLFAGGKGVNVSMVLSNLGHTSVAYGFIAGFTGRQIADMLDEKGVDAQFIELEEGLSRINVKIRGDEETEINATGPVISDEALAQLHAKLDELKEGDYLVLSGSIPPSMPDDTYERILERLDGRGIRFVVDATGALLLKVLPYRPYLIKPNNHELAEMFDVELHSLEDIARYAVKLREMGAQNVVVSMAGDGALLAADTGRVWHLPVPKGTLVNSVGAGDSLVAGFTAASAEGLPETEVFRTAVCTGSASAFSEFLATKPEVEALLAQLGEPEEIII